MNNPGLRAPLTGELILVRIGGLGLLEAIGGGATLGPFRRRVRPSDRPWLFGTYTVLRNGARLLSLGFGGNFTYAVRVPVACLVGGGSLLLTAGTGFAGRGHTATDSQS